MLKAILSAVFAISVPATASALAFNWSWTADGNFFGTDLPTIKGTISGLHSGHNSGAGVLVAVTQVGDPALVRNDWLFSQTIGSGPAFTVFHSHVVAADAYFVAPDFSILYLGPVNDIENSGYHVSRSVTSLPGGLLFTVPEAGSLAALGLGAGLLAAVRRRRRA